jgi:hypothetical protein
MAAYRIWPQAMYSSDPTQLVPCTTYSFCFRTHKILKCTVLNTILMTASGGRGGRGREGEGGGGGRGGGEDCSRQEQFF